VSEKPRFAVKCEYLPSLTSFAGLEYLADQHGDAARFSDRDEE
jgi:hypothetical protein